MTGTDGDADSVLTEWYAREGVLDLNWLEHPSRHHFRWRQRNGRWVMAKRRFSSGAALCRHFRKKPPMDLYVSTSAWLDPVDLPRLRDETKPAPILLDHLVVFDLDLAPFSRRRLETVRRRTSSLLRWLNEHTDLQLIHVTFSGGKGFHVVLRDPDRSAFAIADPREREKAVRTQRKSLLDRVLQAGHAVDPTVTADTRRIIRMPGSLHGRTRWACAVLEDGCIHQPLRRWVGDLPRSSDAIEMPRWPKRAPKAKRTATKPTKEVHTSLAIEVSTHVTGTKDRTAIVVILPSRIKDKTRLEKFLSSLPDDVGPCATFSIDRRFGIIVPRAFPRPRAIALLEQMGLKALAARHRTREHAWTALLSSEGGPAEEIVPLGWSRLDYEVGHPWSRPHLELCHRLGIPAPPAGGDVAGSAEPSLRLAKRR